MSIDNSAILLYGAKVRDGSASAIDKGLRSVEGDVGWAECGPYDYGDIYLTTFYESADLGQPERIPADSMHPVQVVHWGAQIRAAAEALGVELDGEPGWLLMASES